jgi:hypothetical protein
VNSFQIIDTSFNRTSTNLATWIPSNFNYGWHLWNLQLVQHPTLLQVIAALVVSKFSTQFLPDLLPANLCSQTLEALNGTAPLHAGNPNNKLSLHLSGYPIVPRPMYLPLHSPIKLISQELITACIGSRNWTFDESGKGQP